MRNSLLALLVAFATSFTLFAQAPAYYNNVDVTLTGTALLNTLSNKITVTQTGVPSYTPGVWNALKQTDLAQGSTTSVILIYGYSDTDGVTNTDRTRSKDSNGGGTTDWNREHTYPKSLGQPNLGTSGPGADVHHLRASDVSRNGSRGSRKFADGSGNSAITAQGHWYPGDEFKGDVARMMMYMYLRYGDRCLPVNVGIGSTNINDADMLNLFLEWNAEDPVSSLEDQRNPIVEGIQGNRNPFIDNPAFATSIWGGPQAEDRFGNGGGGSGGNTNPFCNGAIDSYPYSEGWESNFGGWAQASAGDDFNWTQRSGGTPSNNTGPGSASNGSQYIYMEASTPNFSTKRAILYSPCFDLSSQGEATFSFKYHMYGASNMGSLAVEVTLDGSNWTSLWNQSGNQGNSWKTATIDLADYLGETPQFRFNGVTGTTWQGDMAVDAVDLTVGSGGGGGTIPVAANLNITFDNYPEETSWNIKDDSGTTLFSGGTYDSQADGSSISIATPLAPGCYTLTFTDAYGDGICCSYGNGSFALVANGQTLASGGEFGSSTTLSFCVSSSAREGGETTTKSLESISTETFNFYPNPATNRLVLEAPEGSTYSILSETGRVAAKGASQQAIDLSHLPPGTYFLTVTTEEWVETKKLIKQ
ncbi:MAG: endonuclease I [Neolewinella sp.]|jgi:endonuclease I